MNAIVVVDQNWAIGRNNALLFSLPSDMRRFRALTLDGTIILGRRTLDSFPSGKPLPRRRNIVITRDKSFERAGCEAAGSPQAALEMAGDMERLWVIGGGSVYTALLSRCKRAYVTKVDAAAQAPDTFFPDLDKLPGWEIEAISQAIAESGVTYRFVDYVNTKL